jgi:hypothetical protein
MEINLQNLKKDYQAGNLVPFIGAGLSVPFKVPTWKELIENITEKYATGKYSFVKEAVNFLLERNDYWGAIDTLKKFIPIVDQDIQSEIVNLIEEKKIRLEDENSHNYSDLAKMNFVLYLTTNYENLLYEYIKCETVPILLKDFNFNTQNIFDTKRIFHLHGYISNPGSIVISRESYEELYRDKKYDNLLKLVTGTKKLLFMGFSFDDQFVRRLIKDHKSYFNGNHYIILNNPSDQKVRELKEEYGLITIEYNAENSSHTEEIRKILNYISAQEETEFKATESVINEEENAPKVIIGAKLSDMSQNVENNLFYRKLLIENIDASLIELSSYFYIAAEMYIRQLRNNGMPVEIIDAILAKVFIKYKERYYDTYKKFGDSQQFLEAVHRSLEKIDFGRYAKLFSDTEKSDEDENRGFIHILAEDEERDIWWGENRLNETVKVKKEKQIDRSTIN